MKETSAKHLTLKGQDPRQSESQTIEISRERVLIPIPNENKNSKRQFFCFGVSICSLWHLCSLSAIKNAIYINFINSKKAALHSHFSLISFTQLGIRLNKSTNRDYQSHHPLVEDHLINRDKIPFGFLAWKGVNSKRVESSLFFFFFLGSSVDRAESVISLFNRCMTLSFKRHGSLH